MFHIFGKLCSRLVQLICYISTILFRRKINGDYRTGTVDQDEVTKFGNHMEHWWDDNGPMQGLRQMNTIRVPLIQDGLNNLGKLNSNFANSSTPLKGINILDIGCGGGFLSEALSQLGANITGVDACKELIEIAKLHSDGNKILDNKITYIHAALEEISDKYKNHFDVVVASEIIEHVASKEMFLQSCTDVLKPGGSLFLTTFNKTVLSWFYGILLAEYILGRLPIGTHEWAKFVPPQEAEAILKKCNCDTYSVRGFMRFGSKYIWTKTTSFHYGLHVIKNY